ncbi:hypothetical protein GmRootV15_30070 [Variovorax sp. V15]
MAVAAMTAAAAIFRANFNLYLLVKPIQNAAREYKRLQPLPSGNARKRGAAKARFYRACDTAFLQFATRR